MEISDEAILRAVDRFAAIRGQGILANLLAFGRILNQVGIKVSLSQVIDASRSLEFVDIARRADFQAVLRSNLVYERDEIPLFERAFDCFWQVQSLEELLMESAEIPASLSEENRGESGGAGGGLEEVVAQASSQEAKLNEEDEPFPMPTYSPHEALNKKDFSEMGIEESRAISRAILLIATKIATQVSRR
ncbi:MAG: hypothetical protein HY694_05075, partial [Deltaproteobacteria bacterium]|nr:hypothetical protein [Deltaproteobacteria bacterium]